MTITISAPRSIRGILRWFRIVLALCSIAPAVGLCGDDAPPRLVVVIVIDQFRYDYLERFRHHFAEGGFKLLMEGGANFINAHFRHSQTTTGAGHAVIMSGCHGRSNGIVSNDWLDRETHERVYCVQDPGSILLGWEEEETMTPGQAKEGRSPRQFIGSTVGDVFKVSRSHRPRVISISFKDRAAILLGGKLADAAYWWREGRFVTSDYYMYEAPNWVTEFNRSKHTESYYGRVWDRLLPEDEYAIQGSDDFLGEFNGLGLGRTLPKRIDGGSDVMGADFYAAFASSPFSNEVLFTFAREALIREGLGLQQPTDILCLSLSANDRIGHRYGPGSHEVMDTVVRTDRLLNRFFAFLMEIGLWEYSTIVITSDHGVAPIPERIMVARDRFRAERIEPKDIAARLNSELVERYGRWSGDEPWVVVNFQNVYIRGSALRQLKLERAEVEMAIRSILLRLKEIHSVYTRTQLIRGEARGPIGRGVSLSFNEKRSGDIIFVAKPYFQLNHEYGRSWGTDHGTPYSYDTHVPLLWYGPRVRPGRYTAAVAIADIAPTLAAIIGAPPPAMSTGRVLF